MNIDYGLPDGWRPQGTGWGPGRLAMPEGQAPRTRR
jgi:hypothetical protein